MSSINVALDDVYGGNSFSVAQKDGKWMIWRFLASGEDTEQIVLGAEGMDELRDYFANYYAEDRAGVATMREP